MHFAYLLFLQSISITAVVVVDNAGCQKWLYEAILNHYFQNLVIREINLIIILFYIVYVKVQTLLFYNKK